MTHFTFIRYFVPDGNEFAPGWYQTRNEGRTRIGDVPLSLSDALYDGPNRVIIDDNTPETNTLPVSGGKGVDEFLITLTANSVVIDDDSEANVIVFERDVVITSIERQAGSEGASVAQYVITLSSGKTITLRNPASFTFQHLGDATRTDPISAEDFFTAYEDGFVASDASHPDIIGDASGPSGVQGPMITGTATGAVYEGDLSTSGDLDVNDDTLLASTTPFTISTQGTYGTASIGDDGEWVYKLDNGNTDVRALNSGDTLTDTFVVDVNPASGRAKTQTVTITISGRTDVFGTNGGDTSLGDASTSDNQAIFGFNSSDTLTGGSGDDLLVGGYGEDTIDLSAGGADTVVYRINSSDGNGLVKAEDGGDTVMEFTPGEDKLVILDVNGSPTTLAGLFDSLTKDAFRLRFFGDTNGDRNLSSSELDAGARYLIQIVFDVSGTDDGGPTSGRNGSGHRLIILFDRVTSEALNDRAVWDTLTGGTNFSSYTISTVAMLSSLFGGFGRPGYDAALDNGGFISIIGPDDLPDSYFFPVLNVDTSGSDIVSAVYEGDPSTSGDLDINDDTLLASTTPFTISTQGTYGTASIGDDGEWVYKLDNGNTDVRALNSGDTLTDTFVVDVNLASGRAETQTVTITISGRTDVFGTNGEDSSLGDASTSDNQAIFGFNSSDTLTGGSGDDLLVGGYGTDDIDLSAGGTDTVVYRINSSGTDGKIKAEDGRDEVYEFTPGEDKLVILDVNGSPTTLAGLFDSLTKDHFQLRRLGDDDGDRNLSSSELDDGAKVFIEIVFDAGGTVDGGPTSGFAGLQLIIFFDRVTSEALNDRAVWDTLTGGTNFSEYTISTVAMLSSLFGGFGRPGYDAALDNGGFISIIGPDDLPDSYFFPVLNVDTSGSDIVSAVYEGDPSTSGDLDINDDTLLASTTPFTISTQGTYGTASIGDDGEWVYKLDNGNTDVRALNSGDTLTDTFVVDVNLASGRAETQTVTITISGRTDVWGTNGRDNRNDSGSDLGDARTSDNQAIFGFNSSSFDFLTGGSGDDLLVGGYGFDIIDLSAGGADTVVYRINSSDTDGKVKAEDGEDWVEEFTPGEDKLVILDVNGSPTTLAGLFDRLTKDAFQLYIVGDDDGDRNLSSSELDAGAGAVFFIVFQAGGTDDGESGNFAGRELRIDFDRVTSEALNDRAVWDTLTGGTNTISTVAQLSSLFGGFGRPGYDAALDDGGFISIIGPDDLPDSYFAIISGDETGSVTEGGAPGDDNTGTLTAPGHTITLVSKETTDSPGTSTGTYGTMTFDPGTGVWTYTLDNNDEDTEALGDEDQVEEVFTFVDSNGGARFAVTITVSGANDAPRVIDTGLPAISETIRETIEIDLSGLFTDVEGDELTFTVTLSDGAALDTIGLSYAPDTKMITGPLSQIGEHIIKVVADDGNGGTLEVTFNVEVLVAAPVIRNNGLTYNSDEEGIIIDETILKATSGNQLAPTLLVYTITVLPTEGTLLKDGVEIEIGTNNTFTQADINNGLILYQKPSDIDPSASKSNAFSFTFSDGIADAIDEQTLQITSRVVFEDETSAEDNTIDQSSETTPQKIEAGDGSDIITGGQKDDQIDGGAGDDEIKLTRTVGDVEEDAGADEVLYTFGYDGVGIDGGDEIVGFKRGQDKLTFVVDRNFDSLTAFLESLNGADDEDLTDDDAFIVTMVWGLDTDGAFYFDGVLLHFKEGTSFGGGRIFSPVVQITFDERLGLHDLIEILGGAENIANNFDGDLTAFKNLDEVLPRLFGEGSIGFKVVAPPSDTSGASERASEEPLEPPIYETLSEQHDDDLQPTSFELGGGETDII